MSDWTPEPWKIGTINKIKQEVDIDCMDGDIPWIGMATLYGDVVDLDRGIALAEANANRIVACVNACAGMINPAEAIDALHEKCEHFAEALVSDNFEIAALRAEVERKETAIKIAEQYVDALYSARADVARLREALDGIIDYAQQSYDDYRDMWGNYRKEQQKIMLENISKARAALAPVADELVECPGEAPPVVAFGKGPNGNAEIELFRKLADKYKPTESEMKERNFYLPAEQGEVEP